MGKTIEQMIADGMTAAEIHKVVEKLTKEREKKIAEAQAKAAEEEAKKKREQAEQEAQRLHRQEAREKATIAIINWMIAEDLITVDEADREYINELSAMLGEIASEIRQEKKIVDLMKKLR